MSKLKYDYTMLKSICDEGSVLLLEDYIDKYITRDTRIIAKCIMCDNSFNKSLNKLHKQRNFGCETCSKKIKFDRIKNTMVEKYGVEYAAQNEKFMNKMKATTLEKYGVEHANQNEGIKEKIRQTNLEKYGCEYGLQNDKVKEKRKTTNLEKYGVENVTQNHEIKEKSIKTNLAKYGFEYVSQSQIIKDKIKENNINKYGVEHFTQTDVMKNKTKETVFDKYGVQHISQCPEIKEKTKQTNIEKYGVEYVTQCPEIHEKQTKMSYYKKDYTFPSGNIRKIQGYENFALDKILNDGICEDNIITGSKNVPEIWYYDNFKAKKRRHFVDIYIPSLNKCVEVKSTWTFKQHINIVFLKQQAAKDLGYLYEIWIYDKAGNKIESYY
jgi:hypothetical protein